MEPLAALIFLVALGLIVSERLDRAAVALAGAGLMVLLGVVDQDAGFASIDLATLGLLAGMMAVVAGAEETGALDHLAVRAARACGGRPGRLVVMVAGATAVLSAFLDNLTAILLVAPIAISVAVASGMRPQPLLLVAVLACNVGGTATLIGDPPNIIIGAHTGLSFGAFAAALAPVSLLALVVGVGGTALLHRRALRPSPHATEALASLEPARPLATDARLWLPLGVLAATLVAFFVHHLLHLEPATVALAGGTAMLLVTPRRDAERALRALDWPTLVFFAALFAMVGALEDVGVLARVADALVAATGGDRTAELVVTIWGSALASGIVDNIPFTTAMLPVVDRIATDDASWWALALGACLGGNLTPVAAAANVAVLGIAARAGHPIRALEFVRWGVPCTLITLLLATAWVLLVLG